MKIEPKRSFGALYFVLILLAIIGAITYLASYSRTGKSGVVRDTTSELGSPTRPDRPQRGVPGGNILVTISEARQLGNPRDAPTLYCSLSIRVYNTSDREVRSLMVGFDFSNPKGEHASGSTAFAGLEAGALTVRQQNLKYHSDCRQLTAKLVLTECVIDPGIDCRHRVRPIRQGMIPLD